MKSKTGLAVKLSALKVFKNPSAKEEQYTTDSEVAADILWNAFMNNDIKGKVIADFGAGTGILGIGALMLGAKKVFFVEKDKDALNICKENLSFLKEFIHGKFELINKDISEFNETVDVVIENPPFGTKQEHADKIFLEKAFTTAPIAYSIHKTSTKDFVLAVSKEYGFEVTRQYNFLLPLKATMKFHSKKMQKIEVSCFRIEHH